MIERGISRKAILRGVAAGAAGLTVGCGPEVRVVTVTPTTLGEPTVAALPTQGFTLVPSTPIPTATLEPTFTPTATPTQAPTETPTHTPTPEKPGISSEMSQLKDKLASEIEAFHGRTAISITDVMTGESIDVNGDRPQLPGCVANLPLMLAVVGEMSAGKQQFYREEMETHIYPMVRNSNPHEGVEVIRLLGGGDVVGGIKIVNEYMEKWGMEESTYDHPPAYPGAYTESEGDNQLVANEMNAVLAKLAVNKLFTDEAANMYAKEIMSDNKFGLNFMIPGLIPEEVATVVHKVGWFYGKPNTINDAGIVFANDGSFTYSIIAMHEGDEHIDEESLFQDSGVFLSRLSRIAFDTISSRYS